MRWIAILAFSFVLTASAFAAGADDQYLDVYNQILQGDNALQSSDNAAAAEKYLQAQTGLQRLHQDHPDWNPGVVKFRLDYLTEKLAALQKFMPAANAIASSTNVPVVHQFSAEDFQQEIAGLREQIRSLNDANADLQRKVKEALTIQPAAASPAELAKAQETISALQKEKDLLNVALEQARTNHAAPEPAPSSEANQEVAQLKTSLAASEAKLADVNRQLDSLKAAPAAPATPTADVHSPAVPALDVQQLTDERDKLKESLAASEAKLAAANSQLDSLKSAPPAQATPTADVQQLTDERDKLKEQLAARSRDLADAEAHRDQDVSGVREALKQAQEQRDNLQKQLAAKEAAPAPAENATSSSEVEQLRARVAVLEASPVPYTPQELAVLKESPSQPLAEPAAAPMQTKRVIHSMKDLPPGSGPLMAEAMRASMERDYDKAEQKYLDVLHQDENNVYVLAHLANAQFAAGHLDACEKTVLRALALDPDDPASLYLLGVLRYRQEKLNEALDALSRSAQYNPTNAGTQNYLGCVLADKGLRPAAETALRKALQLDPDYGDAHYNLAFLYATEKPPSPELARWHYKRATDLGHPANADLEKLMAADK